MADQTPESPALQMLRQMANLTKCSDRRNGYALRKIVEAAIEGGLRFDSDDLIIASKHSRDGGFTLLSYLGEDAQETLYSRAAADNHRTAMLAIEKWIGRPRFVYDGKVLTHGSSFRLPDAVGDGNQGGWVRVTSFSEDGKYVNVKAREDVAYRKCPGCERHVELPVPEGAPKSKGRKLIRLAFRDLDKQERARRAIVGRAFEAHDNDPPLREFEGKVIATEFRASLPALANLEIGDEITVTPDRPSAAPMTFRRIAYLTHDILNDAERDAISYYDDETKLLLPLLVRDGLLAPGLVRYGLERHVLTDAGRARLRDLSTTTRRNEIDGRAAAQQKEGQSATEARKARVAPLLAEFTETELATVVTSRDSIKAGNCQTGTKEWIAAHAPGRSSMTVRELIEADGGRNPANIRALIRIGIARAARRQSYDEDDCGEVSRG